MVPKANGELATISMRGLELRGVKYACDDTLFVASFACVWQVLIWSRPPGSGMRAGKLSRDILYNMGITDGAVS